MSTTIAPPQNRDALAKQPVTSVLGYGLGDFACNLSIAMTTTFLLYYMTDVAGISAAAVGTMFLVVRLWDAFTDLFAGRMVDKTMTRFGKFRPFLLWFAVPVLFMSFLNFNIPSPGIKWLGLFEWNLDYAGRLLYAYLAYAILGLMYSLINIPYGSLASAMTQSVGERAKLVASRAFGAAIGGVLLTYIISPQIAALQKTAPKLAKDADAAAKAAYEAAALTYRQNLQNIFTQTTLLFVLIGSIAFFLTFWWCRESVVRATPTVSISETFDTLKSNKALAYLCAASFFYLIAAFAVGGSTAFYAKYVMGDIADREHGAGQRGHQPADHPVHPRADPPPRQEDDVPVLRRVHCRRRRGPVLRAGRCARPRPDLPGNQGRRRITDQHRDVRPRGRHGRVR